jgi:glycosyltransferase involved in cell wall biosynthesis
LIKNGVSGFVSDDIGKLHQYCQTLLADDKLARNISKQGRASAIKLFGKETIKKQWADFFNKL